MATSLSAPHFSSCTPPPTRLPTPRLLLPSHSLLSFAASANMWRDLYQWCPSPTRPGLGLLFFRLNIASPSALHTDVGFWVFFFFLLPIKSRAGLSQRSKVGKHMNSSHPGRLFKGLVNQNKANLNMCLQSLYVQGHTGHGGDRVSSYVSCRRELIWSHPRQCPRHGFTAFPSAHFLLYGTPQGSRSWAAPSPLASFVSASPLHSGKQAFWEEPSYFGFASHTPSFSPAILTSTAACWAQTADLTRFPHFLANEMESSQNIPPMTSQASLCEMFWLFPGFW